MEMEDEDGGWMKDGDRKRRKEEGREQEKKSFENVLLVLTAIFT
jgi:hypothetical protein